MTELQKRALIQDILEENHYSDWWILRPGNFDSSPSAKCILLNVSEGRKAELVIPDAFFRDPRRHNAISELIKLGIESSRALSQPPAERQFFVIVPKTEAIDSKDPSLTTGMFTRRTNK